jgi:hypothetical protein
MHWSGATWKLRPLGSMVMWKDIRQYGGDRCS